jgi:diacylglycerol kinase family enzyme
VRLVLVTNARSGGSTDPQHIATLLRADGAGVDVLDIGDHERAGELGADRVVVAGGDGSIGPVAAVCARYDLPLAVLPTGTANDFVRALQLPLDVEEAAALARRPDAQTGRVELHRAGGRPFVNAASAGVSVAAAEHAHDLKRPLGPLAYVLGAVRAGTTADPIDVVVRCDGELVHDGAAWQVIVAGTGAFGGGSRLDVADPADGALDVAVLRAGPRPELILRAAGMRRGDLVDQDGVLHAKGREIEVVGPPQFNVDGEVCEVPGGRFRHEGERFAVVVG